MKPLTIIIILPSLAGGGAEKVILSLIENLNSAYFKPILILQNRVGPLTTKIKSTNIINLKHKHFRSALPKLIKTIRIIKPDIIISTFPHITLPLLIFRKYFYKGVRIIAREPNMINSSLSNSPYPRILKYLHKKFMLKADKIIVTSEKMKKDFIDRGIKEDKLFLVHNPVDDSSTRHIKKIIRFPGNGLRFVIVGRVTYQKGIDRVIPMLSSINNCHLTILGDGLEKSKLENSILNLRINKKVKFISFSHIANSYIAGADYLLLPSRWEGLPNVALESFVLGTPVITFKEIEGLNDFVSLVPRNALRLCSNEYEMKKLLRTLKPRKDYIRPIVRDNLLKEFNDPKAYSKKIEKMIKELIIVR